MNYETISYKNLNMPVECTVPNVNSRTYEQNYWVRKMEKGEKAQERERKGRRIYGADSRQQ